MIYFVSEFWIWVRIIDNLKVFFVLWIVFYKGNDFGKKLVLVKVLKGSLCGKVLYEIFVKNVLKYR